MSLLGTDSMMVRGSHGEHVTGKKESGDSVVKVMLPVR